MLSVLYNKELTEIVDKYLINRSSKLEYIL